MNLKKSLENRVKGWIPKEPSLPKSQMKVATPTKMHLENIWNPLWIAPLCITLTFFTINYFIFHIPLISAVIAVAIVDLAVVLFIAREQKNRLKSTSLGWVPKDPNLSSFSKTSSRENKFSHNIKPPIGATLLFGLFTFQAVGWFLEGAAAGVSYLWFSCMVGVFIALNILAARGKELNLKLGWLVGYHCHFRGHTC